MDNKRACGTYYSYKQTFGYLCPDAAKVKGQKFRIIFLCKTCKICPLSRPWPLSYYDLYVDVEDRRGYWIRGYNSGKHSVNIKNLRIINSQEDGPGFMIISFSDSSSLDKAQKVLKENGYMPLPNSISD